ncbi:MAG: S41 family peptidase, partial [Verrucomicrobiota bacterium]|nr:S41 family peptidase [Verrucomicrobiota bacterium]
MFRRVFLFILVVCAWSAAANLSAQTPAKPASTPPTPTPSATPAPSPTPTPSPTTKSLVDSMDPADLKEAIQLLRNNYIKPETLNEAELSRATFEGILTRLGRGVLLLPASAAGPTEPSIPFYGEILDGHVGYLRPGAFDRGNLDALDTNVQTFAAKKVDALVLDLRVGTMTNDFAMASEFAKRFCPKGKPLFSLRKTTAKQERTFTSDRDPSYQGLLIILADNDTAGAAEATAGAVRLYNKVMLIGQPTAGRAVEYSDLKLPSGKILRVAVGEAVLPDGHSLFPDGMKPDVPVEMPAPEKREIFQQSRDKGMTPFVVENARPHLNEAALMAGRNPELEAMEAQRRNRNPEKALPAIHDPVLQRALDLVTSIG